VVTSVFMALCLIFQSLSIRPADNGTVTGMLKTADGKPAVGVRVMARTLPESPEIEPNSASFAGLSVTDGEGHFHLEDIPPGRYVITGGWVDLPTYYPGTLQLKSAMPLTITAGKTLSGIDFTLMEVSYSGVRIPITIKIESIGGVALPATPIGGSAQLRLINEENGRLVLESTLDVPAITVPFSVTPGYFFVNIERLPAGYSLKSITFDTMDPKYNLLRILPPNYISQPIVITLVSSPTEK
jgi:hypothetical protein